MTQKLGKTGYSSVTVNEQNACTMYIHFTLNYDQVYNNQ